MPEEFVGAVDEVDVHANDTATNLPLPANSRFLTGRSAQRLNDKINDEINDETFNMAYFKRFSFRKIL